MKIDKNTSLYSVLSEINFGRVDTKNNTFPITYQHENIFPHSLIEIIKDSVDDWLLECRVTDVDIISSKPVITYSIKIDMSVNTAAIYEEERTENKMTLMNLLTSSDKTCYFSTCDATCLPDNLKHPFYSRNDLLADLFVNTEYKKFLDYDVCEIKTAFAVSRERPDNPVICFNLKKNFDQL